MKEINPYIDGYNLGKAMFASTALPEIYWNLEGVELHIGEQVCNVDGELGIWFTDSNGKKLEGIEFNPHLDIRDARRLAGILVAWADYSESSEASK